MKKHSKTKHVKTIKKQKAKRHGAETCRGAPGDTIRSKIEDKVTEEKLKIEKARRILTRPWRLRGAWNGQGSAPGP